MKISRKLKTSIRQVIHQMVFEHTKTIDAEDRALRIPHESWRTMHRSACAVMAFLPDKVIEEIERYSR